MKTPPVLTWHEELRPVDSLRPYEKNPRQFTERRMSYLRDSIARFGFADPEVINTDGTVIGGHARLAVAKERMEKTIRCSVPSRKLTPDEVKELCFRLNANIGGVFDFDILANEFDLADLEAWGAAEVPGFAEMFAGDAAGSADATKPAAATGVEIVIPFSSAAACAKWLRKYGLAADTRSIPPDQLDALFG